jgi:hypothetical protein
MLVLPLTSTHTPAAWMILRVPSLIPFLALVTSNERCWVISAKRRRILPCTVPTVGPEWLFRFGLNLLGVSEAADWVIEDWTNRRRPPLRDHVPYFIFMLTINIFFCLVLPTQLLRNVKASHHVDLAYLYYLPFCSVFTSKDNFHAQIVPLFLGPMQTFVNGIDFKEDLKKLNAYYSALPQDVLKTGLLNFAAFHQRIRSFS